MKALIEAIFPFFVLLDIVQSSSASCGIYALEADAEIPKILTSPNYPANYNSSLTCYWKIKSRYSSLNVKLKIVSFDTTGTSGACTNETDNLDVSDGNGLFARYCGSNVPGNLTISSTGDSFYLFLKFTSRSIKTKKGFKMEYMAAQDDYCGSFFLDAEIDKPKILTSPNYPANYPPQAKCSWLITAPSGKFVKLDFTNFALEDPVYKYFRQCNHIAHHTVKVIYSNRTYSSDVHLLGKYCDSIVPANVISSKRYLTLVFSSRIGNINNDPIKRGFRLEYSALPSPASYYSMCTGWNSKVEPGSLFLRLNASSSYQYIRSPLYPDKYPSNLYCRWHITASSSSKRIKAEVTDLKISNKVLFSCTNQPRLTDALEIKGGDNSARYCDLDNDKSKTVISSGQHMTVVFRTNAYNFFRKNTAGFEVRFVELSHASILKFGVGIIMLSQSLIQMI